MPGLITLLRKCEFRFSPPPVFRPDRSSLPARLLGLLLPALSCVFRPLTTARRTITITFSIYSIDVEGGQGTLLVSPSGASLLIDTGWPGNNGRDAHRVSGGDARLRHHDDRHMLITHFHVDHVGGVPESRRPRPIGEFLDHGENREDSDISRHDYAAYVKAIAGKPHRTVHPGDTIDIPGLSIIVVRPMANTSSAIPGIKPQPTPIALPSPRPKPTH